MRVTNNHYQNSDRSYTTRDQNQTVVDNPNLKRTQRRKVIRQTDENDLYVTEHQDH